MAESLAELGRYSPVSSVVNRGAEPGEGAASKIPSCVESANTMSVIPAALAVPDAITPAATPTKSASRILSAIVLDDIVIISTNQLTSVSLDEFYQKQIF
jgi:hypothetical protein